ncbi:MAG: hypothetical protein WDN47_04065 [Candidatus Doudnabacteria bacterium]
MGILAALKAALQPAGDISDLILLFRDLKRNTFDNIPPHIQVHFRKGDAFQVFRRALADPRMTLPEQDAVRAILKALRADQQKQEYFILHAAAHGGLDSLDDTVVYFKYLATMSTDEALKDLEDLDVTQPHATIKTTMGTVVSGVKKTGTAIKNAEAAISTGIDNSKAKGLLDRWATSLENKTGIKP